MAMKIRKQTLSLSSYLDRIKEEEIREDQDVQRLSGQWETGMVNELIVTVLTDDYIPPIILGEEELADVVQQWIIDGLQRSSSLLKFRYGNYKITSVVENSRIEYQQKKLDENKKVCRDHDGNIVWEAVEFDIKGKTYEDLPKELKKKFNDYQMEMVVHQNCTMEMISKLVRRYNNHKSMNTAQRAFTYVDKFARRIRNITEHGFFKDCGSFTEKEKINGVYERVVCESVMTMFHLDNWQKQGRKMGAYINENATDQEFEVLEDVLTRLESILSDDYKDLFTSKDSFIWFTLFYKLTKFKAEDSKFAEFLNVFRDSLHSRIFDEYGGKSFDSLDDHKSTKDKKVIIQKLNMLEKMMTEFLHIGDVKIQENAISTEHFIADCTGVDMELIHKDMVFYNQVLDDLEENAIKMGSKLLDADNRISLLAMVVYSCKCDIDLDKWLYVYAKHNHSYDADQKRNYLHMVEDLEKYLDRETCI